MSWDDVIECQGSPRDLGQAQGRAARHLIRKEAERQGVIRRGRRMAGLRAFASGEVLGQGMGREIVRHYPHLAERMAGIARGAGIPYEGLMEWFVRTATGESGPEPLESWNAAAVAIAASCVGSSGCGVVRSIAPASTVEGGWGVRRSAPEHGFRSVELTQPWLASAVAGINQSGLAVAIAPSPEGGASAGRDPACGLLVQECLQRFEETVPAIEWCLKRPSSGNAALVLADRAGEIACVSIRGSARQVLPPSESVAIAGVGAEGQAGLRKDVVERGGLIERGAADRVFPGQASLFADCAAGELRILEAGREPVCLRPA